MDIYYILRIALPFIAAAALAWIGFSLARSLRIESSAARQLRGYMGDPRGKPSRQEQIGERIAGALPLSPGSWQDHLRWAQRGGYYTGQRLGLVFFNAALFAVCSLVVVLLRPAPLFFLLPLVAFAYPLVALRGKANRTRRRVVRSLPDIAALVAAEVAAGTPADQAVLRAAELPGPLSGLLGESVAYARQAGRPLFSRHKGVRGALVDVFDQANLPALRAFARQLDEVANKGVDSAELMNDMARSLGREYREHVLSEKEKLSGRLTTIVALHFFFPAVLIILMAFLLPMLDMFSR